MKHYTLEQWTRYVMQEPTMLQEEQLAYEEHLNGCDVCLELYMQSLDLASSSYPVWTGQQAAFERMMNELQPIVPQEAALSPEPLRKQEPMEKKFRAWLRHPIFHYAVAASITMLLMGSGAFQTIMDRIEHENAQGEALHARLPDQGEIEQHIPVSQMIMNKTIVMLDSIQGKQERGGTR